MRIFKNTKAATAIEYALLAAMFVLVCILAMQNFSSGVTDTYSKVETTVTQ